MKIDGPARGAKDNLNAVGNHIPAGIISSNCITKKTPQPGFLKKKHWSIAFIL